MRLSALLVFFLFVSTTVPATVVTCLSVVLGSWTFLSFLWTVSEILRGAAGHGRFIVK